MSVRGLWVLSSPGKTHGQLLFSRYFPTVEKRAKLIDGDAYVPIPELTDLKEAIFTELGLGIKAQNFSATRDSCDRSDQRPVLQIPTSNGELWPVLVIEQHGLLFCCLPLVDQGSHTKPPLIKIQGLTNGFSLLLGMMDFLGQVPKQIDETYSKLGELSLFVGEAAPLGFPLDTNPHTVRAALQGRVPPAPKRTEQQAAWRPMQYKGRAQLQFTIKEHIRAAMYDKPQLSDVWDVYGSVTCKADLEGSLPEVTCTLNPTDPARAVPMDHIIVHPCVQSVEHQGFQQGEDGSLSGCRLRLTPPLESFPLCHYTAHAITEPPVQGFYQMKGEKTVEVLLQLKLSEHVKNNFEYCEVQLPFHHRGPILSHDSSSTHGSTLVSPDKKVLVWNIGQRFPQRTLEVQLKSTIHFNHYTAPQPESGSPEEMFCVNQNCFAQLFFKMCGYTLSGLTIDPKSIHITPSNKHKTVIDVELLSGDYRVWNSHGEVPTAFTPPPHLLNEMQTSNR